MDRLQKKKKKGESANISLMSFSNAQLLAGEWEILYLWIESYSFEAWNSLDIKG